MRQTLNIKQKCLIENMFLKIINLIMIFMVEILSTLCNKKFFQTFFEYKPLNKAIIAINRESTNIIGC